MSSFSLTGRNSNATDMGKKGSWFSAIKRVFTHHSKGKVSSISSFTEKSDFFNRFLYVVLVVIFSFFLASPLDAKKKS